MAGLIPGNENNANIDYSKVNQELRIGIDNNRSSHGNLTF